MDNRRPAFILRTGLQALIDNLRQADYECLGPVELDDVIQLRPIKDLGQLPKGVRNLQEPGRYRLRHSGDARLFCWNHGPQGLKPLCFAAEELLWSESRSETSELKIKPNLPDIGPTAVLGIRACDLAALSIQDRHFMGGECPDPHYRARREQLLLIGVDCAESAQTCFCASTGDGPALDGGLDIGLAELDDGYLIWAGSEKGRPWVDQLVRQAATDEQLAAMLQATTRAAEAQTRRLPAERKLVNLYQRLNHIQWQDVAKRCISCGNCTSVCPTCFCYSMEYMTVLDGQSVDMLRRWESCFNPSHGEMGYLQVRSGVDQRYRQWLTHKLAGWQEQLGRSGCTGCGRCITWCPVGIDLTREVPLILPEAGPDE